jgi:cyclic pyranopterin phosphate synthase
MLTQLANKFLPQSTRRQARRTYSWWHGLLLHGDPLYIRAISIETSLGCNRRCSYCPISINPTPYKFSTVESLNVIIRALEKIKWSGPLDVIHLNEPTLNPNLPDIISELHRRLLRSTLHITSNGDTLNRERLLDYIKRGVKQFNVTRHPPYRDEWDTRIGALRKEFPQYFHYLACPGDEGWTTRGGTVKIPGPNIIKDTCEGPSSITITMAGEVLMCCNDYMHIHVMGNLYEQGLHEIFYSPRFIKVRKELRKGIVKLELCKKCMEPTT